MVLLTLHAKLTLTKVLLHLRLNLAEPYQKSGGWAFFIAILLKFYLPPCV